MYSGDIDTIFSSLADAGEFGRPTARFVGDQPIQRLPGGGAQPEARGKGGELR